MKKFEITEEQIKKVYSAASKEWKELFLEMFPDVFKHETGWYRDEEYMKWMAYRDFENDIIYGFSKFGEWFEGKSSNFEVLDNEYPAPEKEVEERLIEEAKRRGYNIGVKCIFGDAKQIRAITNSELKYARNNLYMGNDLIFRCDIGEWAEIISTPEPDEYITLNNIKYKRCN